MFEPAQVGIVGEGKAMDEVVGGSWSEMVMLYMERSMDLNGLLRTGAGLTSGSAGSALVAMLKRPSIARKSLR